MGSYRLAESTVGLIEAQIKTNIAGALSSVRTYRNDALVTLESPKEYFRYEQPAYVYQPPAIFTILKSQDIRSQQMGSNHINSLCDVFVAIVIQDRNQNNLVTKSWRYQAALMQLLHEVTLTSSDSSVKLFCKVQTCEFSQSINIKDQKATDNVFRKEVSLRLQVEHIENFE